MCKGHLVKIKYTIASFIILRFHSQIFSSVGSYLQWLEMLEAETHHIASLAFFMDCPTVITLAVEVLP